MDRRGAALRFAEVIVGGEVVEDEPAPGTLLAELRKRLRQGQSEAEIEDWLGTQLM